MSSEKRKWFDPRAREPLIKVVPVPAERVTQDHLNVLFASAGRNGMAVNSLKLFQDRARLDPLHRLQVNLAILLERMFSGEGDGVYNAIPGGLTPLELSALSEVHSGRYPSEALTAAHGLLNTSERETVLQAMRPIMRTTKTRGDAVRT